MSKIIVYFSLCLFAIGIYSATANNRFSISPDTYVDDGKPYMEFTCTTYLEAGDQLMWQREKQELVLFEKKYGSGYETIKLLWPLQNKDNNSQIFCARRVKNDKGQFYSEDSKIIPIVFRTVKETITNDWGPWVWPVENTINKTNIIELSCWAYLYENKLISWYETQDLDTKLRLSMIHQENIHGYVKLELTKAVKLSDNGSNIFCANGTFESGYSIKNNAESQYIPLTFQTHTEPLANMSSVWVTPDRYTDEGKSVMEFTCHAYLQTTEVLSWFQVTDSNITKRIEAIQQDENNGYKEIKLLKSLQLSDNDTQIYCAKETVSSSGILNEGPRSDRISIFFQREKPYVSVEPRRDILIFTENEEISLVCSGSKPVNNRTYTWHIEGPHSPQLELQYQFFDESINQNNLELIGNKSYHQSRLYCVQEYILNIKLSGNVHKPLNYGELVRSNVITLLYKGKGNLKDKPQVTPKSFVDKRKPYMEFTCFAFAEPGEVLSWYRSQASDQSEDTLLKMVQLEDNEHSSRQWMELTLRKTLEKSDNNRDVYCEKQKVLKDGKFSKGLQSQRISIGVQREIKPLVPSITIEPTSDVFFEDNSSLRFNCSGSDPIDGRSYTWFRIDTDFKLTVPEAQTQVSRNQNFLELPLNESYHRNQLFCAQVFVTNIRHGGDSLTKHYGELVASDKITLFLRHEEGMPLVTILASTVTLVLVMVAIAVAVCVVRRRRAARPALSTSQAKEEHLYANMSRDMGSTEVTYAELQFSTPRPRTNTDRPLVDETCEYATIVPRAQR